MTLQREGLELISANRGIAGLEENTELGVAHDAIDLLLGAEIRAKEVTAEELGLPTAHGRGGTDREDEGNDDQHQQN